MFFWGFGLGILVGACVMAIIIGLLQSIPREEEKPEVLPEDWWPPKP